jgi:hypothetical protein
MNKPAFLVDGFTEKLIIGKICPNSKINRINCNGNSVTMEAIAKRIASLVRILNNRHYPIIVIIDRELREENVESLTTELKAEIGKNGVQEDIRIGICDRMVENWIISDWESFKDYCKVDIIVPPAHFDGIKGKGFIKSVYPQYQETTDGVSMFLRNNPNAMRKSSPSFNRFIQQLTDVECNWLNSFF